MTHPMHQIAKALSAYGRQGDTKLAHVTPREERILKSFGGIGSKNPHTGLVEYYGAGTEGSGGLGGSGVGPGAGNVGGGFGGGPTGGDGGDTGGGGIGLPDAFTQDPIGVAVGLGMPGTVGLYTGVKALAGAKNAALDALGLEGTAPAVDFSYPGEREGGGERDSRPRQPVFAGAVPGLDPLMRPGDMDIPGFLDLSPAQTPLQQRSQIATFGTQGVGEYGSEEAQGYWKNLVSQTFLDDQGGLVAGELLPIEQQYASQVLGLQPSGSMTEFLRMIA